MEITKNIDRAVEVLREGGTIAHPADTCYGLAADFGNEESLRKLQQIKGRDGDKPMSIMLPPAYKMKLGEYVLCNEKMRNVCERLFPGPVTIVLPKGPNIPTYFFPKIDTIGMRIPYDMMTDDLLNRFRGPLITTSANLSGEPVCCTAEDVRKVFENQEAQPDLIFDGAVRNHCMPSTVIKVEDEGVRILREGPITKKQLEAILGMKIF